MSNMMKAGMEWLAGKMNDHAGESVTITQDGVSCTATATLGKDLLRLFDQEGGARIEWTEGDFLIDASAYKPGGSEVLPKRGAKVVWVKGTKTYTFEVTAPGDEPEYRFADEFRIKLRVHAKLVSVT